MGQEASHLGTQDLNGYPQAFRKSATDSAETSSSRGRKDSYRPHSNSVTRSLSYHQKNHGARVRSKTDANEALANPEFDQIQADLASYHGSPPRMSQPNGSLPRRKSERRSLTTKTRSFLDKLDIAQIYRGSRKSNELKHPVIEFTHSNLIVNRYIRNFQKDFNLRWEQETIDSDSSINNYKRIKVLGTGTFGEVYLGQKISSNTNHYGNNGTLDQKDWSHRNPAIRGAISSPVAIKTLKFDKMKKLKQTDHVRNERRILFALKTRLTVNLVETFQTPEKLYLVMEFVSGGELFYYLHTKKILPLGQTRFYMAQVIMALHYLHALDIIYRDLKPENILISTKNGYLKLTDFGFAKRVAKNARAWTLCGTPDFLAPEIILSKGYGKAVDFWACGCLMYEMLVGRTPFVTGNQSMDQPMEIYQRIVNPNYKPGFPRKYSNNPEAKSIINSLLQRDRSKRIGSLENDIYDIYQHNFFGKNEKERNTFWSRIHYQSLPAEYLPKVIDEYDTRYFMG